MIVYRIARANRTVLDGKGAALYPGRWNNENVPCVYTSASPSLAQLEMMVNVHDWEIFDLIPYALLKIEVSDLHVYEVPKKDLPARWSIAVFHAATQDFGTRLLNDTELLAFSVPSAVTKIERNIVLNPHSSYFQKNIKVVEKIPLRFDKWLLK